MGMMRQMEAEGSLNLSENFESLFESCTSSSPYRTEPITYITGVCAIIFSIVGSVGNALTILALTTSQKLRNQPSTWFVLNLSTSDLIFSVLDLPFLSSIYLSECWVHGEVLCKLIPFMVYAGRATSLMSLVAITVNRYSIVVHHAWYKRIYTRVSTTIIILFVWLFCFGTLLLPLLGLWGSFGLDAPGKFCVLKENGDKSAKSFIYLFFTLVPCSVVLLSYARIYIHVRSARLALTREPLREQPVGSENRAKGAGARKAEAHMTRMMLYIVICFFICYLPTSLVYMFSIQTLTAILMAEMLVWSPCWLNTLIYALSNREYRKSFRNLFRKAKGSLSSTHDGLSTAEFSVNGLWRHLKRSKGNNSAGTGAQALTKRDPASI